MKYRLMDMLHFKRSNNIKEAIKVGGCFALYYSGLLAIFRSIHNRKACSARIFSYHNVSDERSCFFPKNVSVKNFESQIKYLKRNYTFVSLDRLIEYLRDDRKLTGNFAVITFDDGYRSIYLNAYPILRRYEVPATIFLTTGYIGASKLLWTNRIDYMFQSTKVRGFTLEYPERLRFEVDTKQNKRNAFKAIKQIVKRLEYKEREKLMDELSEKLKVQTAEDINPPDMLNWSEIAEMHRNGISFGAHTRTHPILTMVPFETAKTEIYGSKVDIETVTGQLVTCFAYPNGLEGDFDPNTKKTVEEAGFSCSVTNINGIATVSDDLFELPRISEMDEPICVFAVESSGFLDFMRRCRAKAKL